MYGGPKLPGAQFPGDDALARRIRDLERAIQQLKSGQGLAAADATFANVVSDEDSLTRAELAEHFLPAEGAVIDGGTP